MSAPEFLHRLLTAAGPSGNEAAAASGRRGVCGGFAEEVRGGLGGSSLARVPGPAGGAVALGVAREETAFAGARTSAFALAPDVAIVVDLTFATDQPGVELGSMTKHTLGSGPVVARGTALHPRVFELLYEAAEREG